MTLYQDLLDKKMDQELFLSSLDEKITDGSGSFVSKSVTGNLYWYFQTCKNGIKRQRYVGPDNENTRGMIERLQSYRKTVKESSSEELVSALKRVPGIPRVDPNERKIILSLEKAGVFRKEGILVGTQAFRCYPLIVGVSLPETAARTGDIDLAYDRDIQVFVPESTDKIVSRIRSEIPLRAIPTLDPKGRSYSFVITGSDLKLEILTTINGEESDPERLKSINEIGFHAQPLAYMDYLIKNPIKSVLLYGNGVLVNLPSPERFAIHKILLRQIRDRSSHIKSTKDLVQGGALLDALARFPEDLTNAVRDLRARAENNESLRKKFLAGLGSLRENVSSDTLEKLRTEFDEGR